MKMDVGKIGDYVIYKNNQLIAVNKPVALGVQPDKTGDKSLLDLLEIYGKKKLHVIHRIDRPASGVVLFAKTSSASAGLNEQFKKRSVKKTYLAVVKKVEMEKEGVLKHFMKKNAKTNKSVCANKEIDGGKPAELAYKILGQSDNYLLVEIDLKTGRQHQIRAQFAAVGAPVKGDVKYGFRRKNKDRSIHLHAWKLAFKHPVSHEDVELVAPIPNNDPLWKFFKDEKKLESIES